MSAYQYIVFPRGKQPAAAEVVQLQTFAPALGGRFAWGTCRDEPRLAVAFEGPTFDHVLASDPGFEQLIQKWESHGCERLAHLGFIKDATALNPKSEIINPKSNPGGRGSRRAEPQSASAANPKSEIQSPKSLHLASSIPSPDYHSSLAHSLLRVERTLERYRLIERLAAAMPYALIAAAALLTIALGLYTRDRLMNSGRESRQQTIERLATEPVEESEPR